MGEGPRRKATRAPPPEPATDPREVLREYLRGHEPSSLLRLRAAIDARPATSLGALLALVEEEFTHLQTFHLGRDLARKVGEAAHETLRRTLFDDRRCSDARLLSLDILAAHSSLPDWRKLDEVARGTKSEPLCAACLRHCGNANLAARDREAFVWYLEHAKEADTVEAALSVVEPLLDAWESSAAQEHLLKVLFDLLSHKDRRVRLATLSVLRDHCRLEWLERIRVFSPRLNDHEFQECLHGMVNRLWGLPLDLSTISPTGFEHFVARWLEAENYTSVTVTGGTADGGVDLRCRLGDEDCVVQCKRWTTQAVSDDLVRKLLACAGGARAVFVTTSTFTESALRMRFQRKSLRLIDGRELVHRAERTWGKDGVTMSTRGEGSSATLAFGRSSRR